ncbi:hypothetical protein DPMN_179057 [Dreissena polymorpha]|uniref:Uncharacterized protein n=1 Tax=Dreissena polymorpha TaxID=45954 RepID=A0A9D4EBQ4_DREPO|nr:hypothetical protein DPMN_179057 [Dreissena polymorpha]
MFFSGVAGVTPDIPKGLSERMCLLLESARVPECGVRGPRNGTCGKGRQASPLEETDVLSVFTVRAHRSRLRTAEAAG